MFGKNVIVLLIVERGLFGRRKESIPQKIGRFVEDHVLEADIIDTFLVASILGAAFLLKDHFERASVRFRNNLARSRENRNVVPLNPNAIKEIGHIVSSKF